MKRLQFLVTVIVLAAGASTVAEEAPLVQDLTAHQRWPWSPKVDISYTYVGSQPTSLVFKATWQGQSEPIDLCAPVDLAALQQRGGYMVKPGRNRFEWDPVAAGYGDQALIDFKVTAEPGNDPRTYLVLNISSGGYTFLADVPEGGWTDAHRQGLMVFRRVPAGTYTLGTSSDKLKVFTGTDLGAFYMPNILNSPERTVTLSSDFYFSIFLTTQRQYQNIYKTNNSNALTPICIFTGTNVRGATLADGVTAVDWPTTGYKVGEDSMVDRLRKFSSQTGQPELRIDLATESQWEVAMRAGTTTFFPTGGTTNNTIEELSGYLFEIATGAKNSTYTWNAVVGKCSPNQLGIYDFNIRQELCLDWSDCTGYYGSGTAWYMPNPPSGLDPVGPNSCTRNLRIVKGREYNWDAFWGAALQYCHTSWRSGLPVSDSTFNGCLRFAIHLKPLVDVE